MRRKLELERRCDRRIVRELAARGLLARLQPALNLLPLRVLVRGRQAQVVVQALRRLGVQHAARVGDLERDVEPPGELAQVLLERRAHHDRRRSVLSGVEVAIGLADELLEQRRVHVLVERAAHAGAIVALHGHEHAAQPHVGAQVALDRLHLQRVDRIGHAPVRRAQGRPALDARLEHRRHLGDTSAAAVDRPVIQHGVDVGQRGGPLGSHALRLPRDARRARLIEARRRDQGTGCSLIRSWWSKYDVTSGARSSIKSSLSRSRSSQEDWTRSAASSSGYGTPVRGFTLTSSCGGCAGAGATGGFGASSGPGAVGGRRCKRRGRKCLG